MISGKVAKQCEIRKSFRKKSKFNLQCFTHRRKAKRSHENKVDGWCDRQSPKNEDNKLDIELSKLKIRNAGGQ